MAKLLESSNPLYDLVSNAFDKTLSPSLKSTLQPLIKWQPGVSPLSTNTTVLCALAVYLGTIFGIQAMMKESKPKRGFRSLVRFALPGVAMGASSVPRLEPTSQPRDVGLILRFSLPHMQTSDMCSCCTTSFSAALQRYFSVSCLKRSASLSYASMRFCDVWRNANANASI